MLQTILRIGLKFVSYIFKGKNIKKYSNISVVGQKIEHKANSTKQKQYMQNL